MSNDSLREEFEHQLAQLEAIHKPTGAKRTRKLIFYFIRTGLAGTLLYYFWEESWAIFAALAYIPLNLLGLASIFGYNPLLNKRINQLRQKLDEFDEGFEDKAEQE